MNEEMNDLLDMALDLNYSSLGILPLGDFEDQDLANEIYKMFPWAKGIIISIWHYNYHHFPKELKSVFDKEEIFQGRFIQGTEENKAGLALEEFMTAKGLKFKDPDHIIKACLEKLAVRMGLGIIRKNSKFYTEEGSFCNLHAWVIDQALYLEHEGETPACPDHCSRCIRQCPVQCLTKAYDKDNFLCEENQKKLKTDKALALNIIGQDAKYLKACDICIDICPFNQDRWQEEENYLPFEQVKGLLKDEDKIKAVLKKMNN